MKNKYTKERARKISESLKKYYQTHKNPACGFQKDNNVGRHSAWNKGIPRSEETKKKISKANTNNPKLLGRKCWLSGKKMPDEIKKKISNSCKGRICSKETLIKMSQAAKKRFPNGMSLSARQKMSKTRKKLIAEGKIKIFKSGKDNLFWKGGKSFEPYGLKFNKELKSKIRERDNYTCQECNYTEEQTGYKFGPHHIDYNKKNNSPNNLILLCKSCNVKANFNRQDWTEYFQNKIKTKVY